MTDIPKISAITIAVGFVIAFTIQGFHIRSLNHANARLRITNGTLVSDNNALRARLMWTPPDSLKTAEWWYLMSQAKRLAELTARLDTVMVRADYDTAWLAIRWQPRIAYRYPSPAEEDSVYNARALEYVKNLRLPWYNRLWNKMRGR